MFCGSQPTAESAQKLGGTAGRHVVALPVWPCNLYRVCRQRVVRVLCSSSVLFQSLLSFYKPFLHPSAAHPPHKSFTSLLIAVATVPLPQNPFHRRSSPFLFALRASIQLFQYAICSTFTITATAGAPAAARAEHSSADAPDSANHSLSPPQPGVPSQLFLRPSSPLFSSSSQGTYQDSSPFPPTRPIPSLSPFLSHNSSLVL
jgi:hypothetical protein